MSAPETRQGLDKTGLACALFGSCLWALSFVIPAMLREFSALDVSLGRYLVFGCVGFGLHLREGFKTSGVTGKDWLVALYLAILGYYGCYTALVYSIYCMGPEVPTLLMGLLPVSVAITANLRKREVPFIKLLAPLALIAGGLIMANLAHRGLGLTPRDLRLGLITGVLALVQLTWFIIANLEHLKSRPGISPVTWANVIGSALLGMSLISLPFRAYFGGPWPWVSHPGEFWKLAAGCAVLGLFASWLGGLCWNRGCRNLPGTVAGQMIVFWPLTGLIFAFIYEGRLPGIFEILGICATFAGVLFGLAVMKKPAVYKG